MCPRWIVMKRLSGIISKIRSARIEGSDGSRSSVKAIPPIGRY